jgi:hypothetical protein
MFLSEPLTLALLLLAIIVLAAAIGPRMRSSRAKLLTDE